MRKLRYALLVLALAAVAVSASAVNREIYPDPAQAKADVASALAKARHEHKRVILDFGGNWCPDCQVLDIYFHDQANAPLLEKNFVLVHVNIGRMDRNQDLAEKYGVPLNKGVPALAVVDASGKALYSQQNGEFEAMRRMESTSVTQFLVKWKPGAKSTGCSVLVNC